MRTRICGGIAPRTRRIFCAIAVLVGAAMALPAVAAADDRNAEFLAALREAGWDDTAAAFVRWVETSPLVTDEFHEQLPLERAASLAAQGRASRNREERARLLNEAAKNYEDFAAADGESPTALDALRQAASVYAELALALADEAARTAAQPAARDEAMRAARSQFDRAAEVGGDLLDKCNRQLAAMPKPTVAMADPEVRAQRDKLVNRQLEIRYFLAVIGFERAKTFNEGSSERNSAFEDASAAFGALFEAHREQIVGAASRFYQGRCAQEIGEYAKALGCFEDLVDSRDTNSEFRRWTARAHRHRAECLIEQEKFDDAIRGCEEWLAASQAAEREQPEWLEVAYQAALAYQAKLEAKPSTANAAKRMESAARELLQRVAERPNEFQFDARLALSSLMRGDGDADFNSFADAVAGGKTALEVMNSALMAAKVAEQNNPDAVDELNAEAASSRDDALRAFELALELANGQTPAADVNLARYFLAVLYWEDDRPEESAVLGEFIASRYPEGEYGARAANLALAAWEKVYRESGAADQARGFAARKLAELAQLVATRWPDAPEAAAAVRILVNVALQENRIDEAETLLAKLPEGSRAGAELSLGAALWTQYLQMTAGRDAMFDEAANKLREKAGALLTSGFAGARQRNEPSASAAVGTLYLVQFLLARGDWQAALDVLEDKNIGPLTLVQAKAEAASRPEFVLETYKGALRAYLTAQPPQREQAQAMMTALDEFAAEEGGEGAAEQLTRVYVGLGVQLQRQVRELTAAGNHLQAQQVAAAFGDVLERVAKRPDAGDWAIRNWIAQTNLQIGQGLEGDEARLYLNRARVAYEGVLAAATKGGEGAPDDDVILGVRKRLGDCLATLGQYEKAIVQYAKVLEAETQMLDVQQAAATAYQSWGAASKQEGPFNQAIHGSMPQAGGKNLIWGWLRIASAADTARRQVAARAGSDPAAAKQAERLEDLFFEARFKVAQCRFLGATFAPAAQRPQQLAAARANVESMRSLYPELGGPKWKAAFDSLAQQINQELQKK